MISKVTGIFYLLIPIIIMIAYFDISERLAIGLLIVDYFLFRIFACVVIYQISNKADAARKMVAEIPALIQDAASKATEKILNSLVKNQCH